MKKVLIGLVILAVLGGGGFFIYKKVVSKPKVEVKKTLKTKKPAINLLELEKRPYVTLVPRVDGHEVTMTIDKIKLDETEVEYELEYQAGNMLQGAGGRIDFDLEEPPVSKNLLFGSCSKGKCKYDDDVFSGSLTLYFDGQEVYGLKSEFTLGKMADEAGVFSSNDVKVSLDVGQNGLDGNTFVIVASTMGLPAEVEGKVLAGPIGFFTAKKETVKEATLTFKGIKEDGDLKVLGWDGSNWQEYEAVVEGETVSAEVDQLATFILVKL